VAGIVGLVALYGLATVLLALVPVAAEPVAPGGPRVTAYLYSANGRAYRFGVAAAQCAEKTGAREIKFAHTTSHDSVGYDYLAFGWGDKGFYYIPGWSDLTFPIAFRAAFHLGTTAMHTKFHKAAELVPGPHCVRLSLTPAQYERLVAYVQGGFKPDAAGRVQYLPGHTYGGQDAFYEGQGAYSFWQTCNTWTNNGLKVSGQRAALWTPLTWGLFRHYGK
jgi:uncharacterized protein (TIGR02117 family)